MNAVGVGMMMYRLECEDARSGAVEREQEHDGEAGERGMGEGEQGEDPQSGRERRKSEMADWIKAISAQVPDWAEMALFVGRSTDSQEG